MLETMKEQVKSKYGFVVDEFAYFKVPKKQGYLIKIGLTIFGTTLFFYLIDLIASWDKINFLTVVLAFVLFVLVPILKSNITDEHGIFVTKEYLIQPNGKKEFTAIKYDDIVSFRMTSRGIFISDSKQTIILSLEMYRDEIDQIIQILEAKGKTFDNGREYMIRPVEITFKNNKVVLVDLETESIFDRLYQDYQSKYETLTPRFLDAVDFTNAVITEVSLDDNNWIIKFDLLKVKEDHPENTQFEPIIAADAFSLFHQNEFLEIFIQNPHNHDEAKEDLIDNLSKVNDLLKKAVVLDVQLSDNQMKWMISSGVHLLTIKHKFDDVLIGWNKIVD